MSWKESVGAYFRFSRKERVAVLVLSGLILGVFVLPSFFARSGPAIPEKLDQSWADSLREMTRVPDEGRQPDNDRSFTDYAMDRVPANSVPAPFYFDPNELSPEGWKKLGIREKTIQTIRNYLSRGGRFRKPEDLGRIYGLPPRDLERLLPFVRIPGASDPAPAAQVTGNGIPYPKPAAGRTYKTVDINRADTTAFIDLPGIGSKLAARIVNFRDKLGGFYAVEQVAETFGLPDSTFQRIRPLLTAGAGVFRRIDLNTATLDELKAHPYIRWNLARPIIAYREQHGSFRTTGDLRQVMAVTEEQFLKLEPYLYVKGE